MSNANSSPHSRIRVLSREERIQQYQDLGWWVSIPLTIVSSHWLYEGEYRLDARYYAQDTKKALRVVLDSGLDIEKLGTLADTYYPGRFKRIYASSEKDGVPFLKASEMLQFRPTSEKYLANSSGAVDVCRVNPGTILMTRSGTVGRCVIVSKRLAKFAITDDAIRIRVKDEANDLLDEAKVPIGYLYAFLSSWIGQALVAKDQYGSTVKHLEPHHLANIPIPLLPDNEQHTIHEEILQAYSLRNEANDLLDEANEMLHKELGIPRFNENLVPYLAAPPHPKTGRPAIPHPKAFVVRASELDNRLDASYHIPIAKTVISLLQKGSFRPVPLSRYASNIFLPPRFKRIYVKKEYGVPFLQGSHLPQMRFHNLQYLSRKANKKHIDSCLIHPGYVLVTRSGTIGRIGVVSKFLDGWAASEHLIRIVPDTNIAHSGYIAAFLMTPYGQHQLKSKIYGGVVDELTPEGTADIWIPDAPKSLQEEIGKRVTRAFALKDKAFNIEEEAIHKLENALETLAKIELE